MALTAWQTPHTNAFCNVSSAERNRLLWWDEAPAVLQFNPYVKSGYRAGQFGLEVAVACREDITAPAADDKRLCKMSMLSTTLACRAKLQAMLWQHFPISQ